MSAATRGAKALCNRVAVLVLLAGAVLLTSSGAGAGPRDLSPRWKDPSGPPTEMEVWLRRLVGRYRVEGMIQVFDEPGQGDEIRILGQESIKGMGDCVAVGTGPGVQCVLSMAWQEIWQIVMPGAEPEDLGKPAGVFSVPAGVPYLNPAMALFGLDPGKGGMRYLLVDNKGLPEGGLGSNTGNRATFRTPCVNAPTLFNAMIPPTPPNSVYRTCDRIIRIDARPDARVVHLSMDIEINEETRTRAEMTLRRVQQAGEGQSPGGRALK